ncbi:MAG: hypothetical protein ACK5MQ_13775 [Pikeienuella sp.]
MRLEHVVAGIIIIVALTACAAGPDSHVDRAPVAAPLAADRG